MALSLQRLQLERVSLVKSVRLSPYLSFQSLSPDSILTSSKPFLCRPRQFQDPLCPRSLNSFIRHL